MLVRPVASAEELDRVYRMTHDAYVEKGYIQKRPDGLFIHQPKLENIPETTVLVAVDGGKIIGTNTITADGEYGLHCERDFPLQVQRERWNGSALCCSWRIITVPSARDDWRVLYSLIKTTISEVARRGLRICFMTFQPIDALKYASLLHAEVIGFSESTASLRQAPALLIKADLLKLPRKLLD